MTVHVSRSQRSDRRIMARAGERHALCGGQITDKDVTVREARRMSIIEAEEWNVCADCIRILQREEVSR